ncbi:MAG: pantetheine-phosphate adenylyltransferase [Rhizobiales bacterium]|nr:pantetheine-phosphate adenylyltransferase [Hyphomicrobiales bacterium]
MAYKVEQKIGMFAGSFDPITFGHIDVINRCLELVDVLIIAIGAQHNKAELFTPKERIVLIAETVNSDRLKLVTFDGLLVDEAKRQNASFLIRSIRNSEDFEYEKTLATMNAQLSGIETINLFANPEFSHISSSIVRQIAKMDGDISKFVPKNIVATIKNKLSN